MYANVEMTRLNILYSSKKSMTNVVRRHYRNSRKFNKAMKVFMNSPRLQTIDEYNDSDDSYKFHYRELEDGIEL